MVSCTTALEAAAVEEMAGVATVEVVAVAMVALKTVEFLNPKLEAEEDVGVAGTRDR